MKIALGSDERNVTTDTVVGFIEERELQPLLFGPLADEPGQWAEVSIAVAEAVVAGRADRGILFCWTGTGSCMAANKVKGIRAALCTDAETARGARAWNDANVLVMSLRLTTPILAREIVAAFLDTTDVDPDERASIEAVNER